MDAFVFFAFWSLIFTLDETIDAEDVKEGDHIYRWSCIFGLKYLKTHSHHAIVIKKTGNDPENVWVIEFMRNAQNQTNLQKVTLQEFIKNGHHNTFHRVTYQDNIARHWLKRTGSSSIETPLPSHKVVKRATKLYELNSTLREPVERIYLYYFSSRLFQSTGDGEETPFDHGPWSLTCNNCECCVRWCKVDKWNSLQAANGIHVVCTTVLTLMVYMITSEWVANYFIGKTVINATSLALGIAISSLSGVSREEIQKLIPELVAKRICNASALALSSFVGTPIVLGAATSFMIYDYHKKHCQRSFKKTLEVC